MEMENLIQMLDREGCLGVARSAKGEIKEFRRRGVADLFSLLTDEPQFLCRASVADRVIGRGAALLLLKGGAERVFARTISTGALEVLRRAGVEVAFGEEVPFIINRTGDGMCPVERLTADTQSPGEAYRRIGTFLENISQNNNKQQRQ